MELTGLLTTCVAIPVLLSGWAASEDTFAFDCYSDTGFGHLERAVVLNCSGKALASTAGLGAWLLQHATFAELLAKPKIELTLSFDSNAIRTVGVFPHLPRARRLSLSRNLIQEILPGAFTNLTNLHELDLSHNLITGKALNPDVFRGAFNRELYEPLSVKILNLSGNQIHSLSRSVFEHLQFLEQLDLDNNPIKIVDHTTTLAFSTLSRLKWLDMGYTQLKKIPGEMLRHTPIQTLYLNGNKLEAIPRELGELRRTLTSLNLNDNLMMEVSAGDLSDLGKLEDLEMSGMSRLRRIEAKSFVHLTALRRFVCSYNPVLTDVGAHLFHHPPEEVIMRNNALSTLLKDVTQWDHVRNLDLQSNPWNCDCQIGWLISLISMRSYEDPDFFMEVKCTSPEWLRGYRLDSLIEHIKTMCHFSTSGGHPLTSSKTQLQMTSLVAGIFILAALTAFLIRSGRLSPPCAMPRLWFLSLRPGRETRLHGSVQSSIKYQKADQSEKVCEMIEFKREPQYNDTCV